jgi:hypothetical protein
MKRSIIRSLYLVAMVLALTAVMWWGTGIAPGTSPSVVNAQSKVGDVPPDRRATPSIIKASPLTNASSSPIAVGSRAGVDPLSPAGPWTVVAPLPTARYGNGGAGDGTFYYSVGGSNIASMVPDVFRYDPVGDTWTSRAPIPTAVQDAPVVFAGGKLYVLGGLNR